MNDFDRIYDAAYHGESWSAIEFRYGDSVYNRRAWEAGLRARHSSRIVGFVVLAVIGTIYLPFIVIACCLLYPLRPTPYMSNAGAAFGIYIVLFLALVYLQSCLFEYLRARMLQARYKNRNWEALFIVLFVLRIIIPAGGIGYLCYLMNIEAMAVPFVCMTLVLLIWKVQILNPRHGYFFTDWAYRKGDAGMQHAAILPEKQVVITDSQLRNLFLVVWVAGALPVSWWLVKVFTNAVLMVYMLQSPIVYLIAIAAGFITGVLAVAWALMQCGKVFRNIDIPARTGISAARMFYIASGAGLGTLFAVLTHYSTEWTFLICGVVFVLLAFIQSKQRIS
jgi:hypothetical protein